MTNELSQMDKYLETFKTYVFDNLLTIIFNLIIIILGYVAVRLILKIIKKILERAKIEHTVKTFIFSISKISIYIFYLLIVLATIGVNVTSIIAAISAAAITAGLAIKDSLGNIASGVIILMSKPFLAGDILEFEGIKGSVISIKIFSTTIKTFDNKLVTIPNSRLTANNVVNCTMVEKRRLDLSYTISYEDDIAQVKDLIYSLIDGVDKALKDPKPAVNVGKHMDSGLEIVVWIWVNPDDYYDVYYYMQEKVKLAFDENGITIPYPHLVVKEK